MKLNSSLLNEDIERSGDAIEGQFTIKTTAKAFDILSSGLYSDKVLAVIRELACNAHDAQVEAGTTQPFEIHLPNTLEPFFYVRDFGVGLSDEQIFGLYTTYFDSTKTNSNAYIGALGLGSKSPFSYTRSFTVTSRYDGVSRVYSVFINENGIPSVARMTENDTDEANGLEVRMGVKPEHFEEFRTKTEQALKFFKVRPKVVGNSFFAWPVLSDTIVAGSNFNLREQISWKSRLTVIQGNVPYPLDLSQFTPEELGSAYQILHNGIMELYFELGDLEVSASRESIQYDPITKQNIINATQQITGEILQWIADQMDGGTPIWTQYVTLDKMGRQFFGKNYRDSFAQLLKDEGISHPTLDLYAENAGRGFLLPDTPGLSLKYHQLSGARFARSLSTRTRVTDVGSRLIPNSDVQVMLRDIERTSTRRMAKWLSDNPGCRIVAIVKWAPTDGLPYDYDSEIAELLEALGQPSVMKVSELDDFAPEYLKRTPTKIKKEEAKVFINNSIDGWNSKIVWTASTVNLSKGRLYVELERSKYISGTIKDGKTLKANANAIIKYAKEEMGIKLDVDQIVGVGKHSLARVKAAPNWFNANDIVDQAAIREYRTAYMARLLSQSESGLVKAALQSPNTMTTFIEKIPTEPILNKLLDVISLHQRVCSRSEYINMLANVGGHKNYYLARNVEHVREEDLDDVHRLLLPVSLPFCADTEQELNDRYPMLALIGNIADKASNFDRIAEYINLVNATTGESNE